MNMINESDSKYKCDDCGRMFSRKVQYEKHIQQHFPTLVPEDLLPFDCKVCGKAFKNQKALTLHSKRHSTKNKLVCTFCGKKFCQRSSLKMHLRTHDKSSKFECEMCDKCFLSESDLKIHLDACHDGKPFFCKICHERFSWRDQMASHYCVPQHESKLEADDAQNANSVMTRNIDVYQVADDQSIICGLCQRQFSQKGHLILHYRRTHNRELLIERIL